MPPIATAGDLAEWLGLSIAQLDWFADTKRQHASAQDSALRHYRYTFVFKRSGLPRLLEAPKPRLKDIQRRILHEILDHAPIHACAHGFAKGRSCLSSASVHASEAIVLSLDLCDFFSTVPSDRIHGLFRSIGYPWSVAHLLTGLCTTVTPRHVLAESDEGRAFDWHARNLLSGPHLPQGAPTSPALANLCAWKLDQRLNGLANRFDAHYTRYADDLTFSGDDRLARAAKAVLAAIEAIVRDEGFALNRGKTRIMPSQTRQKVTGIVVNTHTNIARPDYDRLKAVLYNCKRNGPVAENRSAYSDFRSHLNGKVTWVENVNPARGAKLRTLFDSIAW
ncbi:MAG TPA: reverse transcriptase family protein [Rhizomicrobium sp.]